MPSNRSRSLPTALTRGRQRGFTLAEVAIVFLIVALLIGGTVLTFSAQNDARQVADTQRTLDQAREAMMGFALRNGRLPCPAPGGGIAVESFCTNATGACGAMIVVPPNPAPAHGRCWNPALLPAATGFVPAATLGIGPIETTPGSPNLGLLVDSWLQPIRYIVTDVNAPAPPADIRLFTATGEIRRNLLATPPVVPDLLVCTTGAGAVPNVPPVLPACGAGVPSFQTPAVLYSTGKNASAAGVGTDEQENANGDRIFVERTPTPFEGTPLAGFDDLVIWISPNILYHRMIAAGAL